MGKVADFYKKVEQNPVLKEELLALNEKYKEQLGESDIQGKIEEEVIAIAGKHDYVLTKEDFAVMQEEEIDEQALDAVAGGASCLVIGFGVGDQSAGCIIIGKETATTGSGKTGYCVIIGASNPNQ